MLSKYKKPIFLLMELILYGLILTLGGTGLVVSSYVAIVLCFLYVLLSAKAGSKWMLAAIGCTAAADFFLVVCDPIEQLWGMVFFLCTQTLYAVVLHKRVPNRVLLILRVIATVASLCITVLVLGKKCDALALISLCYYANLIMNIVTACTRFRENTMFAIALILFLLCDTVIGLQVASGTYLPIGEKTWIYRLIFMDFNLSWFFYLPSQVMLAWIATKEKAH